MGPCQLVHLVGLLHEQCQILVANTRTTSTVLQEPGASATSWVPGEECLGNLLTNSPRVSLVAISKMLQVMQAGGRDCEWTPLTASRGCVWLQTPTLTYGFEAARPPGTGIIPGPQGLSWEQVPPSQAG